MSPYELVVTGLVLLGDVARAPIVRVVGVAIVVALVNILIRRLAGNEKRVRTTRRSTSWAAHPRLHRFLFAGDWFLGFDFLTAAIFLLAENLFETIPVIGTVGDVHVAALKHVGIVAASLLFAFVVTVLAGLTMKKKAPRPGSPARLLWGGSTLLVGIATLLQSTKVTRGSLYDAVRRNTPAAGETGPQGAAGAPTP